MSTVTPQFFCRDCDVPANGVIVDDGTKRIECPKCGVVVEGAAYDRMMADYRIYFTKQARNAVIRRRAPTVAKMFRRQLLQSVNEPFYPFKAVLK